MLKYLFIFYISVKKNTFPGIYQVKYDGNENFDEKIKMTNRDFKVDIETRNNFRREKCDPNIA